MKKKLYILQNSINTSKNFVSQNFWSDKNFLKKISFHKIFIFYKSYNEFFIKEKFRFTKFF